MLADPLSVHGIRGIYRMTTDYIGMENMPSFDEFADIYGKMAINGFEICDDMGQNRYIFQFSKNSREARFARHPLGVPS